MAIMWAENTVTAWELEQWPSRSLPPAARQKVKGEDGGAQTHPAHGQASWRGLASALCSRQWQLLTEAGTAELWH